MVRLSVATMYAWRWMAELERGLIGRLTWKELAFLVLQLPLGTVAFTVAVTALGTGLGALLAPAWTWAVDDAELNGATAHGPRTRDK